MMRIENIDWLDCEPGAAEASVAALEQSIGVRLPEDFRRFAATCQCGRPVDRRRVPYTGPRGRQFVTSLGGMLRLDGDDEGSIRRTMENLAVDEQLPAELVPFGEVGDGDLFCFRYHNGETSVVLWLHAADEDAAIVPIAATFTEFLRALESP